jgi:Protein of unknown function (DUF4239)
VILAFVIFVAFQGYTASRDAALRESSSVRRLFKESDLLPPLIRAQVEGNLVCYARGVITLDWPAMESGRSSAVVDDTAALIDDQLGAVHASGARGPAIDAIFADAARRDDARADRVNDGKTEIPGPVWIVLGLGAISVLAYVVLFADPAERFVSQAVMVGSVTIVIVGGLILIYFLSHPFQDQMGSIKPSAMERTLTEIQTDPAFSRESSLPLACDAEGRPQPA